VRKISIAGLAAFIGIAGLSGPANADLISKTGPVIAILAGHLFLGEAEGHLDGAGTIAVQSQGSPKVTCSGHFTSSAEHGGRGEMRCSDGVTGIYRFKRLSLEKGYGAGTYGRGSMSFTYGLTADESRPYLKLPPGKKLERHGNTLQLVDAQAARSAAPLLADTPDQLLNAATLEVIAAIGQDKDFRAGNPMKVAHLVETKILPLFDFPRMTRLAVARNWHLASPAQQISLTREFKALLVRSYSAPLSSYRGQTVEFLRPRMSPEAGEVTVKSYVIQPGKDPVSIDYDMEKTPAGWKAYDVKVGGVSLITTYREAFAEQIRDGGVDGLISSLSGKNRQGDSNLQSFERWSVERFHIVFALMHGALQKSE